MEKEHILIVFAKPDPYSSLQSIAWCQRRYQLNTIFIYHTAETKVYADRLSLFCNRQWPEIKVIVPGEAASDSPESVVRRLRDWRSFRPNCRSWTLDFSGATASMMAGVSRAGGEFPEWELIRREKEREWLAYTATSGGRLKPRAVSDPPTTREIDDVDLANLIPLLYRRPIDVLWRDSRAPDTLAVQELASLTEAGPRCNWEWRAMHEAALGRPPSHPLWGFADFVAATLAALGAHNTRINLSLRLNTPTAVEKKIDIATLFRGTLWYIRCVEGADDAAEPFESELWRQPLVRRLVINPKRPATVAESLLASDSTELFDSRDCRNIFAELCELLDLDVPKDLQATRKTLSDKNHRLPVFTSATSAQKFADAARIDAYLYDIEQAAISEAGGEPSWTVAHLSGNLWFMVGSLPQLAPPDELRKRLQMRLGQSQLKIQLAFFELSPNRLSWRALLRYDGEEKALVKWLRRWRDVPFIT